VSTGGGRTAVEFGGKMFDVLSAALCFGVGSEFLAGGFDAERESPLFFDKLFALCPSEGELTEGRFLEQIEDDGLIALAKTIVDRAEEKISLESELRRLTGIEEETTSFFPIVASWRKFMKTISPRKQTNRFKRQSLIMVNATLNRYRTQSF
jgi:hypothetical protein